MKRKFQYLIVALFFAGLFGMCFFAQHEGKETVGALGPKVTVYTRNYEDNLTCYLGVVYFPEVPTWRGWPFVMAEILDDRCGERAGYYLMIYPIGVLLNIAMVGGVYYILLRSYRGTKASKRSSDDNQ